MKAFVTGAGLYGDGFPSFDALCAHAAGGPRPDPALTDAAPRPSLVPPRELRRLPDAARLGVEVATQACAMAAIDPGSVLTVFTSTIGDSAITDYMCRTLAGEQKLLSPLRFQNSVHNAPGGSLSIITGNRQPSGFVAAFDDSFALALLEALVQCTAHAARVLLVCTDVPVPAPLSDVHGMGALAGCAVLLEAPSPVPCSDAGTAAPLGAAVQARAVSVGDADGKGSATLQRPATRQAWPLLMALAEGGELDLTLPVGSATDLHIQLGRTQAGNRERVPA